MSQIIHRVIQEHDLRLVFLAVCICALACTTTSSLLLRAQRSRMRLSWKWIAAAGSVFGCGIWSLHFVAMLAFMPGMQIAYDIKTTVASAMIAWVGAFVALLVWRYSSSRFIGAFTGGTLLGLTMGAMHYTGIAGMRLSGTHHLIPTGILASFAVGIGFAVLTLFRSDALDSRWRRAEVSLWLAIGICGLHFIGMSVITIDQGLPVAEDGAILGSTALAVALAVVTLALLVVSLAATMMEQHLSQRAVRELQRLQLMCDLSQEALIIFRAGIILRVNAAAGRLFDIASIQLIGRDVLGLISEEDQPLVVRRLNCLPIDSRPDEVQIKTIAGMLVPAELSQSQIEFEGKPAIVFTFRDLTDRKRDEARIRHLAHHDALTDLPNRFLLQERIPHALDIAARTDSKLALLYLDLDRFKLVNDLLGHAAGDALLIEAAQRILSELSAADTLARVGGDEFVITTMVDQPDKIALLANRLIEVLLRPFTIDGQQVEIGASIGIALFPEDGETQNTLMASADTALYHAKEEKRGTFLFFEAPMNDRLQKRRQLEQDLRHAVERNELQLHYQPMINCASGEVEVFEALLRWNHPQRGLVPPADFISLAEDTGLIVSIGEWVLEEACRVAALWTEPRRIAVNVSPVQFRQCDLLKVVSTVLARTGLPADRLEIEVTEGVLMEDTTRAVAILSALRKQGVRVALDDFGTGYSSLSYLHSFAFDQLKIDKSFISGLGHSKDAEMIVKAIIGLAHGLGLSVIAEGVETPEQLALIRDFTCDHVQGYLLGRPSETSEFTQLAAARVRMLLGTSRSPASDADAIPPVEERFG